MHHELTIVEKIRGKIFLFVLLLFSAMACSIALAEYFDFRNASRLMIDESYTEQKRLVKGVVETTLRTIKIVRKSGLHVSVKRQKEIVLEALGKIRFGCNNEGYIFVVSYDGTTLLNNVHKSFEGKNLWNYTDPQGVKVIQEERKAAENPEGAFISYSWKKPSTGIITPKISFIMGDPQWKWIIGAGVYRDDVENLILELKHRIIQRFIWFIEIYFFIALLAFLVTFFSFRKVLKHIEDDISFFIPSFEGALRRNEMIEAYRIRYKEFRIIAEQINTVIEAKRYSDRKAAVNETKYRDLFIHTKDVIIITDEDFVILDANQPSLRNQFGYELNEITGRNISFLFKDKDEYARAERFFLSKESEKGDVFTVAYRKKSGDLFTAEVLAFSFEDSELSATKRVSLNRDVTRSIKNEQMLEKSLEEKKVLLREVHHRVKNNMAIIIAFLSLQSMSIEDEKTKELLETAENRIRTMALVHEFLYQDEHLKDVSLRDYVETLTAGLVQVFGSTVKVSSEIVDISLEMDILIPFGLLVNEIVTNALKYAFRDGHTGSPEIIIRMSVDEMGVLHFNIRDNGTGLPAEEQYVNKHSIGLTLIDTLIQQINGELNVLVEEGTEYRGSFPVT